MTDPISDLTQRQREILQLIGSGVTSSKELARETGLSPGYIDKMVAQALKTLGCSDRRSAAVRYQQLLENSDPTSDPRDSDLPETVEPGPSEGTSMVTRFLKGAMSFLKGPPLGGEQHSLRWDQVTLQILRVAAISLIAFLVLVLFILGFFRTFS